MKKMFSIAVLSALVMLSGNVNADQHKQASQDYMPSLITTTPLEGRMLAMTIVRKTIGAIQTNKDAKHRVRKIYAEDPVLLMRAVELVNLEFKIIAEANNYWKK